MNHDFFSALILLLLVLDPLGGLPVYLSVLKGVAPERKRWVAVRESAIAMGLLVVFMLVGDKVLYLMRLSERSLEVAGGVILLMVAIRMIFVDPHQAGAGADAQTPTEEPLIFPLAIPLLAGPSALATVLLLASRQPEKMWLWAGALACAMLACMGVLLASGWLQKVLGQPLLNAMEKLMGLILTAMAVEMVLAGLKHYFAGS